ncbi:endonuclease/exonuclease/phosphatase family protein [Jiangella gansuensis]|uniref:endonuclease/exonuclease/phosphatase family protein n=1 Tax=Jiangella gansuensis TaxID=281473 RepID=UPI0004B73D8E|nr:endonuclease/exonuclease/phosphatase family protein [Jiangella gansuensis]
MPELSRRTVLRSGTVAAAASAVGAAAAMAPSTAFAADPAHAAAAPAPQRPRRGTIRVLTWNIYRGGTGVSPENLPLLLDQLVALRPDVYLAVETYGAGDRIRRELSRRAGNGQYTGIKITDRPAGDDNLWIFTHLPVDRVHPRPAGGTHVTDFNLGGVRLRLPNRRQLDAFVLWCNYTNPWDGYLIDENAAAIRAGLTPRHSQADVVAAGSRQTAHVEEVVRYHLPAMVGDDQVPLVIGGDFNTLPAADWTAANAGKPNHFGMSYGLTATRVLTDAGFVDTFRAAHPDAAVEGRTWSPLPTERLITPQRIDMIFAKGDVTVRGGDVVDTQLSNHQSGTFYSDHAAVWTDLSIR